MLTAEEQAALGVRPTGQTLVESMALEDRRSTPPSPSRLVSVGGHSAFLADKFYRALSRPAGCALKLC